jgi:hypothetical protein
LNGNALNGYDIAEPLTAENLSRTARANLTDNILFEGIYGALIDEMGAFDETQPLTWCMPFTYILISPFADAQNPQSIKLREKKWVALLPYIISHT